MMTESERPPTEKTAWRLNPRAAVAWNFISFQLAWFVLALAANRPAPAPLLGVAVVAGMMGAYLALRRDWKRQAAFLFAAGAAGAFLDSLQSALGVFAIVAADFPGWLAPLWYFAFYANFASTLPASLQWLARRPRLGAALGALGGPLSYYSGARLGPIALGEPLIISLLVLGVVWAVLTPLLFALARRLGALD